MSGDVSGEGWIRLHPDAAHHRKVALEVLGVPPDREEEVAGAVGAWKAGQPEQAVVRAGGA